MTFEGTIKKISAILAAIVIYTLALSFYLGSKGFTMDENGNIYLVGAAEAKNQTAEVENKNKSGLLLNTKVDTSGLPFLGKANAPVTIYEYSSFGCSHCASFHLSTLPKIKKDFIDTGKVKLYFVDFPIDNTSMKGALLSHCIPDDKYFDFLDIIFKNQNQWAFSMRSDKLFANYASLFNVTEQKANACMKDNNTLNTILNKRKQAMDVFKIQGTPSFVLENKHRQEIIFGAASYAEFKKMIEQFLSEK